MEARWQRLWLSPIGPWLNGRLQRQDSRRKCVRDQRILMTAEVSKIPASHSPPLNANHSARARRMGNRSVSWSEYTDWWDS
jgi:hypothetical protein